MVDQGKANPKLVSVAQRIAGEMAVKVIDEVVQLHGGYGYLGVYGIERLYRDAKLVEIVEGTEEIEKLIIARNFLEGDTGDEIVEEGRGSSGFKSMSLSVRSSPSSCTISSFILLFSQSFLVDQKGRG